MRLGTAASRARVTQLYLFIYLFVYIDLASVLALSEGFLIVSFLFPFLSSRWRNVWLTIIGFMIATSILFWFAFKVSPYSLHRQKHPLVEPPTTEMSFSQVVWLLLGAAVGQGNTTIIIIIHATSTSTSLGQ